MIRQLEAPLRTLAPNRRVYIVRNGLVYQYPARIVRDMANDMWVGPEDDTFEPVTADWSKAAVAQEHYMRGTNRNALVSFCRPLWNAQSNNPSQFDTWWDSVSDGNDPYIIACAASHAARNVITWSLFVHRNEVDTSGLGA